MPKAYNDLLSENARLREQLVNAHKVVSRSHLYIWAVVVLSSVGVMAIFGIYAVRPDQDNTQLVATVMALVVTPSTGFLAMGMKETNSAINGRLSQLLELTERASRAEGKAEGKAEGN